MAPDDFSFLARLLRRRSGLSLTLEKRGLIERQPHPQDGRAVGLHATEAGQALMRQAEQQAAQLEQQAAHRLSPDEHRQLIALLQRIYQIGRAHV